MKKNLETILQQTKQASSFLTKLSAKKKTAFLLAIATELEINREKIFEANRQDILLARKHKATEAFLDRLTFSEKGFQAMIGQLIMVAKMTEVLGEIIEEKKLLNGIHLQKIRFPIGVIAMIYESRPNVTIDAIGLCIKSGNAIILKGGSEAQRTNRALVTCVYRVFKQFAIPTAVVAFLQKVDHKTVARMLQRNEYIDVVIPRGSYALTTAIAKISRIPVLYHGSGGARMYVDESANLQKALAICINAKTSRTGVCNALDTLIVHKKIAPVFLKKLDALLYEKKCEIRADGNAQIYMIHAQKATQEDFSTEFLENIVAIKTVENAKEAIMFIKKHTHHHTEVLIAEERRIVKEFIQEVDSAGLMINCSSRFHDGGEFGMGAEIGIATGKLHARGPVGLSELTTYKWIAFGNGQVRK